MPRGTHPNSLANLKRHPAPPAPQGHTRSVKHGLWSENAIDRLDDARREILAVLADSAPVRDADGDLPAADHPMVELAARSLARVRSADDWIAAHGIHDGRGKLRPVVMYLEKATQTLDRLLEGLGMNPRSRAALGVDLARTTDLALAMSHPDPQRRESMMVEAGVIDAEDGEDGH